VREYPTIAQEAQSESSRFSLLVIAAQSRPTSAGTLGSFKKIFQLLLDVNSDSLKENSRLYPIDYAAMNGNTVAMEMILGRCPELAILVDNENYNLVHRLGYGCSSFQSHPGGIDFIRSFCRMHPQLLRQRTPFGAQPLHETFVSFYSDCDGASFDFVNALCEVDPSLVKEPLITLVDGDNGADNNDDDDDDDDDEDDDDDDGRNFESERKRSLHMALPLHLAIHDIRNNMWSSEHLEPSRILRLFLRLYPEAAIMKDAMGRTPYNIAKEAKLGPQIIRLLLRAAPEQSPRELRELNWAERRMAIFLSFKALSRSPEPTIFAKLRFESRDLLRRVVSYL
jgi:hypothetical protein